MEQEEKNTKNTGFQGILMGAIIVCLIIGLVFIIKHHDWSSEQSHSNHDQANTPNIQSFALKLEGTGLLEDSTSNHYIGTITDDRAVLTLDCIMDGERCVTTLDFNPRTSEGTWITSYPDTKTLLHGAHTDKGQLTAVRTSERFPIFQITMEYGGKTIGYGALVPVSNKS